MSDVIKDLLLWLQGFIETYRYVRDAMRNEDNRKLTGRFTTASYEIVSIRPFA